MLDEVATDISTDPVNGPGALSVLLSCSHWGKGAKPLYSCNIQPLVVGYIPQVVGWRCGWGWITLQNTASQGDFPEGELPVCHQQWHSWKLGKWESRSKVGSGGHIVPSTAVHPLPPTVSSSICTQLVHQSGWYLSQGKLIRGKLVGSYDAAGSLVDIALITSLHYYLFWNFPTLG